MNDKKLDFTCKRTFDTKYSSKIIDIKNNTLLTPKDYKSFSKDDKKKYEDTGYVIGNQSKETMSDWISNDKNIIIVANTTLNGIESTVGYLIVLQTKEIQEEVKNYIKDMINLKEGLTKNLEQDFSYLIQLAVHYDFIKNGIGSAMFDELKKHLKRTVVSFVMKNPLHNEISLYSHIKAGFQYFGDYIGEYDKFENYQSIGLMLPKSNIDDKTKLTKDYIKEKMKEASKLYPIKSK